MTDLLYICAMGLKDLVIGYTSNYSDGIPYGVLSDVVTTTGGYSIPSLNTTLYRLSKEGRIEKTKDGNIKLLKAKDFSVLLDEENVSLYKRIKERFPFSTICMWNTDSIINLMHDVPGNDLCIINVEKDILSTFLDVLETLTDRLAFYDTDKSNIRRFSSSKGVLVISQLVSQAPLREDNGITYPRIEKILVDILCENALHFLSGSQAYDIYDAAFEKYDINKKALLRYAGRRSRAEEVNTILEEIER